MYQPNLGRWLTPDPIGFEAGDPDLYRFVGNNPVNEVDPSGLQGIPAPGTTGRTLRGSNLPLPLGAPLQQPIPGMLGGADITDVLTNGLNKFDAKYKTLTLDQKQRIANSLYHVPDFAYAWDTLGLIGTQPADFGVTKAGEDPNTATVLGKVYYTAQINYVLWGRINRLLSDDGIKITDVYHDPRTGMMGSVTTPLSCDKTIGTVANYRKLKTKKDGYGVDGFTDWAKIGWDWSGKFTSVPAGSLPDMPNPRKYTGVLTLQVGRSGVVGALAPGGQLEAILEVTGQ